MIMYNLYDFQAKKSVDGICICSYLVRKCEKMVYWRGTSMTPMERARPRRLMSLEPIDQFLATLMRLKVGLFVEDIAERFGMSNVNPVQTVSPEIHSLHCLTN